MSLERPRVARTEDAYGEADPTAFSPVPSALTLQPTGEYTSEKRYPIYTDGADRYVKLMSDGPRQEVVARLLKGVLNVADVVARPGAAGTEYYSKIMPHERIEEPSRPTDVRADLEVISLVFNDQDRGFREEGDYSGAFAHNLIHEAGRVSHFDFGEAELNLEAPMGQRTRYENPALLERVLEKLEALRAKFAGDEGKAHFLSIIEASGQHPARLFPYSGASANAETLYEGFVGRLDRAIRFVAHEYNELTRKAA